MKQELIYNILPIKAYEIELKCFYASHFILGRIFALWNKKKKAIKVSKDYFLKIKHLKKPALWVILKELQDKNIITITRINNNNNVMIIDFTDDFIKNYVNAEIEAEAEAESIDEIAPEDIEECDNGDIEEVECENLNAEETETEETTNADYNPDDDYLPVEGWRNTDRQDFRCLLRKYGGKVPEVPKEVLNFDFGKIKREDYPKESYITSEVYIYTYDSYYEQFLLSFKIKEFIKLRENKELMLFDWLSFYDTIMEIWEHLKAKGLV